MTAVSCVHLVYMGKKAPDDRDMGIQSSACSGEWGGGGGGVEERKLWIAVCT